ncbi:hypothetical protein B5D82_11085 [Cognaticolwellia beringensis]|uniref:Cxxc_20_cxxc protein n=1 Tax=Cognaticolwellia beringensis TaxID=1967665 RepID=A0A222GA41_9GAMM|nr:hypothetical protein B5D82_11085 [Cognaticolwellia beringensis]
MNKYRCPYCDQQSVSLLRKLILSPIVSYDCSACYEPISVPFKSTLLVVPSLLILFFGANYFSLRGVLTMLTLSLILTAYLHVKFVPLTKAKL